MLKKAASLITNNFGLKVLAAIFAICLWLAIVNTADPNKTVNITLPVSIENEQFLTDQEKTYEIRNNSDMVTITVTGARSIVENISESDFSATANMENVNESMTQVPINVTLTSTRYDNQIDFSKQSSYMYIDVENVISKEVRLTVDTQGSAADDCYVAETDVSPEKIKISGPESVVSEVEKASVSLDITGAEDDISQDCTIELLNGNNREVSQDRLTLNRTTATVNVGILMQKTLPISLVQSNSPPNTYRLKSLEYTPEQITVVGKASLLDTLDEISVNSPLLDMSTRTSDFSLDINLTEYLPDGVSLKDSSNATIKVNGVIEAQDSKEFELSTSNISFENLPNNLNVGFSEMSVSVTLLGYQEDLDKISSADLKGTVDASGFTTDTTSATVTLEGGYTTKEPITVEITVMEKGSSN